MTQHKLLCAALSTLLMVGIANPWTYKYVNGIVGGDWADDSGCPKFMGHLAHTLVFFVAVLALMVIVKNWLMMSPRPMWTYVKYAMCSTLLFYFVTSREMYKLTGMMNSNIEVRGCPTNVGILFHGFMYFVLLYVMMSLS